MKSFLTQKPSIVGKTIIDAKSKAINTIVYDLYGLSEEEIAIVAKSLKKIFIHIIKRI